MGTFSYASMVVMFFAIRFQCMTMNPMRAREKDAVNTNDMNDMRSGHTGRILDVDVTNATHGLNRSTALMMHAMHAHMRNRTNDL
mmetsp:Transcript_51/g.99  ORF Transcript_51/g.99 Transcript_51/m.99 type:complete len:85 (-) Transcript_51:731-985(-)